MKLRVTTLLSLTGVLVAGSAAALVNTQVLQSTSLRKSTASEITVGDTQSPTTAGTTVTNKFAQLNPQVIPAAGAQTSFQVGTAGTVVLDDTNGVLSIVSVTPADGWQVVSSESDDNGVEVKLQSATQLVEFKASIVGGQIVPTVEATDLTTSSVASSNSVQGDDHESDDQNESHHSGKGGSHDEQESGSGGDD